MESLLIVDFDHFLYGTFLFGASRFLFVVVAFVIDLYYLLCVS